MLLDVLLFDKIEITTFNDDNSIRFKTKFDKKEILKH